PQSIPAASVDDASRTLEGPSSLIDNWGDHTSHSRPERVGCRHPSERWPRVSPRACLLPTRRGEYQAPYGLYAPAQRVVLRGEGSFDLTWQKGRLRRPHASHDAWP